MESQEAVSGGVEGAPILLDPGDADAVGQWGEALRAAGRGDAAMRVFRRAVALAPGRPELHLILGCLLRDAGDLAAAERAFVAAAETGAGWGLPRLYQWRLFVDVGMVEQAAAIGDALAADCPEHAEEVLSDIALDHARKERWPEALNVYRRLAALRPEVRAMLGDLPASGAPAAPAALAARATGGGASGKLPPMAGRFAVAHTAGGWERRRVLLLMPRHIRCNPRYIEHDLGRYLAEAARQSGLEVEVVDADDVTYPEYMTPERRAAAPAALRAIAARIRAFAPDLLVVDCNAMGDGDTVNPGWLRAVRAETRCRVVGVLPDNYGDTAARNVHWAPAVDAFLHFEPTAGDNDRMILGYVPPPACFRSGEVRDIPGLFVGSTSGGGLGHRVLWLAALKTALPEFRVILGNRLAAGSPDTRAYAALLGRARISVNFGRRASGPVIVTGRTYESIKAGCLLLEQAGSALDRFFVEGRHYLAFRDAGEMVGLAHALLADEDRRAAMAAEAQAFMEEHYAARFLWPYVIARLG